MRADLVTVIICVYNAGEYLRACVESVLAQTHTALQILIVDDGSTDGCMASIADLADERIEIIRKPNGGKPSALNAALERAHGAYYALQDADDLSAPTRIAEQLACLQAHPSLAGVFCGHDLIIDGRRMAPRNAPRSIQESRHDIALMHMPGHDPTAMYRMAAVRDLRYDEALPIVEGYDYILRVGEQADLMVLGRCLYSYRIHLQTVTKSDPRRRCLLLRQAVEKVRRRRGLPCAEADLPRLPTADDITHSDRDNNLSSHFMVSVVDLLHAGDRRQAISIALFCARLHPGDPTYWKPLVYALSPVALIDRYRRRHRPLQLRSAH